ncbi:MAG: MMPL family transporter [Actinomycetota bacterium]
MFSRVADLILRRPRTVVIVALITLVVSAAFGGSILDRLSAGGFDVPGSDSLQARTELEDRFDSGFADYALLVTVADGSVNDGEAVSAGVELTREVAAIDGTDDVVSYWTTGDTALRSVGGDRALVLLRLDRDAGDEARRAVIESLGETYGGVERGPLTIEVGGREAVFDRMSTVIEEDLAIAELVAIPLTFVVLVVIFGGIVAASLPVGVGILAALGTFLVLRVVTAVTDVSIFALNLVTALGLGLAIDYSLLIVARYREERQRHGSDVEAVRTTVLTSGRTITFSGLVVSISLATLLVFPLTFLRSFAYAGVGVVAFAVVASVVVLPAGLVLLGPRIDRWAVYTRRVGRHRANPWKRLARRMIRRPVLVTAVVVPALVLTAVPFLGVQWGEADDRALPADDPVRAVSDVLRTEFGTAEANAFPVVAVGSADPGATTGFALTVSRLDGVARVDTATGSFVAGANINPAGPGTERFAADDAVWFNVVPSVEPISAEGEALIARIRSLDAGFDEVLVGGGTAELVDIKAAITDRVPLAAAVIALATFVLLFVMFESVLVPVKAIVLNLLSLGATFGLMVWIFQDGNGAGLLGVTATGQTDITTPILMFCIAFGLSMDYEVFLLARIKEEWDRTGDNERAIVDGLGATGRLVTNAAILLSITFLSFAATANVSTIALFGLGLAVAVLVDAFIVRVTLVPALMTLAGRRNWWAPAWSIGLLQRLPSHAPPDELIDLRDEIDLRDRIDLRPDEVLHPDEMAAEYDQ